MALSDDILDAALIIVAEYEMDDDQDRLRQAKQIERLHVLLREHMGDAAFDAAIQARLQDRPRFHAQPRLSDADEEAEIFRALSSTPTTSM